MFVLMYSLPQSYKLYWNIVLCFFTVGNSCKELNVFNETFVLISVYNINQNKYNISPGSTLHFKQCCLCHHKWQKWVIVCLQNTFNGLIC